MNIQNQSCPPVLAAERRKNVATAEGRGFRTSER
jgi:hypothetical protein